MTNHSTTEDSLTDAQAIEQSLVTPTSFAGVFERHFVPVHRYLSRRLGTDLADELGAETFLVAFDRRASYDQSNPNALPWLLGIATNLVRHHWRAERRWLRACERVATELSGGERDSRLGITSGLDGRLSFSIRSLARRDREALLLLAWGELTYDEIATAVGVPIGTVRSRINRARRQMATSLGLATVRSVDTGYLPATTTNHQGDCGE